MVSISNLGVAKTGPTVEDSGSLLLEYVNGSACTTSYGRRTNYTTRIHLVCSRGSLVRRRSFPEPGSGFLRDLEESASDVGVRRPGARGGPTPQVRRVAFRPVLALPARDVPDVLFSPSRAGTTLPPALVVGELRVMAAERISEMVQSKAKVHR